MARATKTYSLSLTLSLADQLDALAERWHVSPGVAAAELLEKALQSPELLVTQDSELQLLREIRDAAIEKMLGIIEAEGFAADITLKTFKACEEDPAWMAKYREYIRDDPFLPGNPRKTNANQTIGSRIKSELMASDVTDQSGKVIRGRAPLRSIIQTYQLLKR